MKNLVIITSIIEIPDRPLSYSKTRSVFTKNERFNQTKNTIKTIRERIPDVSILIVECSEFKDNNDYKRYLIENSDYFINLWERDELHELIFGISKSLGEGVMTIETIRYIIKNKLEYDNYYKISGRYYINDKFSYDDFKEDLSIFTKPKEHENIVNTTLYKIIGSDLLKLHNYLISKIYEMSECIQYEILIYNFMRTLGDYKLIEDYKGISGLISVDGSKLNI